MFSMLDKLIGLKFRKTETKNENSKDSSEIKDSFETSKDSSETFKDPHGSSRFDNLEHDDLHKVEKAMREFTGDQLIQFFGGLAAGVYFTATGNPLVNAPEDDKFAQGNRQEFCDKLAKASEHPDVQQSSWASDAYKMMQGQNNFQEKACMPMPQNTIDIFVSQVYGHAELDAKARAEGRECASVNAHKDFDIECHRKLREAFIEAGYPSGYTLHVIAGIQQEITKKGTTTYHGTCSTDDPFLAATWKEDTSHKNKPEANQGRSWGQDVSSSDSESDSIEEIKRTIQEYEGEAEGEEIIEELEKELEERRRQESGRNSLNTSQNRYSFVDPQNHSGYDRESHQFDSVSEPVEQTNSGYDRESHQFDSVSEPVEQTTSVTACPESFFASSNNDQKSDNKEDDNSNYIENIVRMTGDNFS